MIISPDFIRAEIEKQSYEISLHADDEQIADGLTVSQLEFALSGLLKMCFRSAEAELPLRK